MQQNTTRSFLDDFLDQVVDLLTLLSACTALNEMVQLFADESASGTLELEGPQEVGDFLEVWARGVNFVDHILNALDTVIAQTGLDDLVGGQGNALASDLAIAALVDKSTDRLEVGVAVGNEGLDQSEHLLGGGIDTDEDTVVDLAQAQQLQNLLDLGGKANDTSDADNKDDLVLRGNVDLAVGLGLAAVVDGSLVQLQPTEMVKYRSNSAIEYAIEIHRAQHCQERSHQCVSISTKEQKHISATPPDLYQSTFYLQQRIRPRTSELSRRKPCSKLRRSETHTNKRSNNLKPGLRASRHVTKTSRQNA